MNVPSKMDEIRKEIERIKEIQTNEKKKKRELKIKEEVKIFLFNIYFLSIKRKYIIIKTIKIILMNL